MLTGNNNLMRDPKGKLVCQVTEQRASWAVGSVCTKAQGQEGLTAFPEEGKTGHLARGYALV